MYVTTVCAYHGRLVEVREDLTHPCLLPCVRQGLFGIPHCVHQARCPYASQNSASASHIIVGTLGLQLYVNMAGFYGRSGNWNSVTHTYAASTIPTESSLQLYTFVS